MAAIILFGITSKNFEVGGSKRNSEIQGQNPQWSAFQSHSETLYQCSLQVPKKIDICWVNEQMVEDEEHISG